MNSEKFPKPELLLLEFFVQSVRNCAFAARLSRENVGQNLINASQEETAEVQIADCAALSRRFIRGAKSSAEN
jgi:hypothetical protein